MRADEFEGRLLIPSPTPIFPGPVAPPPSRSILSARFSCSLQCVGAHPSTGFHQPTLSVSGGGTPPPRPPPLKSVLPPISLSPARPQPRARMPARPPPSLPERLLLRAARLQTSPLQCERPAWLGSSEVSASGRRPGFLSGSSRWSGAGVGRWGEGGLPVPLLQEGRRFRSAAPCPPLQLQPFPRSSPLLARAEFELCEYSRRAPTLAGPLRAQGSRAEGQLRGAGGDDPPDGRSERALLSGGLGPRSWGWGAARPGSGEVRCGAQRTPLAVPAGLGVGSACRRFPALAPAALLCLWSPYLELW